MSDTRSGESFLPIIEMFTADARRALGASLEALAPRLHGDEIALLRQVGEQGLNDNARLKISRTLLLELHAARLGGQLDAEDAAGQFAQFIALATQAEFEPHLRRRYPALHGRLQRSLELQRLALESLAARFAADREALSALLGRPAGRLLALQPGEGDLHDGGQTVARLTLEGGRVMYKPRSLKIDLALDAFLAQVFADDAQRIRVPHALDRGAYGWAGFVEHRYCDGDDELAGFYRNLGHWLAVMQLLGGTDIHQENLIAAGPVPVAIDVESLFAVEIEAPPSGRGHAFDLASELIRTSVLRTGIVPFRAPALGFGGVDISAAGALPGEQPQIRVPTIADEGTMQARLAVVSADFGQSQNHPSPHPDVSRYWDRIADGFLAATARLRALDAQAALAPLLQVFLGCRVRDIRRPTQAYVEIMRMLWHPASLHDEPKAIERARDILARNAAVLPIAPSAPAEIDGEIDDMRRGDVPIFVAPLDAARIEEALTHWRGMRVELEELTIRSALVTVDLNQRLGKNERVRSDIVARNPHAERLDARRRAVAARAVEQLLQLAVRGGDGTVTWISPVLGDTGWVTRPLQADLYTGLGGVALALAGYLHEVGQGRADPVEGTEAALDGAIAVMRAIEAQDRPSTVGGMIGFGAQVWTWVALHDLLRRPQMLEWAVERAEAMALAGFDGDQYLDLLEGASGSIVPLLQLAEVHADPRWPALAAQAARYLETQAIVDERGARWPSTIFAEPVGGFAHGASGIGWALTRIGLSEAGDADERARWLALAERAFAFEDSLYDDAAGSWLDARVPDERQFLHAWCHGSVGIGLAASDLYARTGASRHLRTLRRAAAAAGRDGWGLGHTLCHGDLALWELLTRAARLDPEGSAQTDPVEHSAQIVSAIEEHRGAVGSRARDAFTPGLMTGVAGAIHTLNRMHPQCGLASPLLFERHAPA
ncbi:type 2 lanthipeptide synthetase LanM family protein [Lysobacter antibioticus]|uniref:type 2 lanthipeptide synthetase LanM family protein n=1 Tax=Lysobacter antibioticus TaxID=84531 RepID=UPI0004D034FC|nr:type 2 lanthipeptide synthetase LanM family protein [Lysobacter antibioticus]